MIYLLRYVAAMDTLSIKDPGEASKFLGTRVELSDGDGYKLDQQATIAEILERHGRSEANGVHNPIGENSNETETDQMKYLVKEGSPGEPSIHYFQSLVGSLHWFTRCTRPDISFAVHKAMRRTHHPTLNDLKLAKRIARYLKGTKELKLHMQASATRGDNRCLRAGAMQTSRPTSVTGNQ